MRLLCPTLDWPVPHETALSHMRLHCPTLDCKSNMRTTRKKVLPFIAKVSLSWDLLSFLGLGLVLGWELDWDLDGTWTGLGLGRECDKGRTEDLKYCKEIQPKSSLKSYV